MNRDTRSASLSEGRTTGAHRAPRRRQSMVGRTALVGGAAVCIGLLAEMNVPDAHALSILLPGSNGNATQIDIFEGNVFRPQLGLGGNGNSSSNRTIGNIIFGGDDSNGVSTLLDKQIVLGGATGTGNVTQISILSYNIFNPQFALSGNNLSQNTTVSNVAAGNGNGVDTTTTGSGTGTTMIGGAMGAGNSTQISLFSSNIFNPQISLFGSNLSYNTAVTNVAAGNGNFNDTTVTSGGGLFGTNLLGGATGNGNTVQVASGSANIINPQWSLLGGNASHNAAYTNQSLWNGNFSDTSILGGGGLLGASLFGTTGNGNTDQLATFVSNIVNPQWSIVGGNLSDNSANSNNIDTTGNGDDTDVSSDDGGNNTAVGNTGNGINNQTGYGNGNVINDQLNLGNQAVAGMLGIGGGGNQQQGQEVLLTQGAQQPATSQPSTGPHPLSTLVKNVKDTVNKTLGIKPAAGESDDSTPSGTNNAPTN
jgi:hypothetical protein